VEGFYSSVAVACAKGTRLTFGSSLTQFIWPARLVERQLEERPCHSSAPTSLKLKGSPSLASNLV
jgi:hypothetical protein